MKKKLINIIVILTILAIIGITVYFLIPKKENFIVPNGINANFKKVERDKVPGICNPIPKTNSTDSSCPSDASSYVGNCKYPTSVIAKYMCESAGNDCAISGFPAICNNLSYSKEFLSNWMKESESFIGNTPLNKIFIPGSHDTMTYGVPTPDFNPLGVPYYKDEPLLGADNDIAYDDFQKYINYAMYLLPIISVVIPIPGTTEIATAISVALATLPNVLYGIVSLWSKANKDNVLEQLSAGIRYLDLRLTVNTKNGTPTIDNLNFTHTMLIPIKFLDVIRDINSWLDVNKKEIVILDCQYITNLCSADTTSKFFIDPSIQIKIQKDMLDGIQNIFGNKLAPNNLNVTNSYNDFIKNGYQVFIMFDQNSNGYDTKNNLGGVMPFSDYQTNPVKFVEYWKKYYKWINDRSNCISGTFANNYDKDGDPSGSASEARTIIKTNKKHDDGTIDEPLLKEGDIYTKYKTKEDLHKDCYEDYPDTDKLVVFGASVGISSSQAGYMIAWGLLSPSAIDHPNGLLQMAANYGPVLINNIIGWFKPEFFYVNNNAPSYSYYDRTTTPYTKIIEYPLKSIIKAPKGIKTHNIFLYDNVTSFNVSSLIIATIRGELSSFLPDPQPTTNDDQCHLKPTSLSCGADDGFDPNSCKFYDGRCYTQSGVQCGSNSDCSLHAGLANVCSASAGMSDLNCRYTSNPLDWIGGDACKCSGGIPRQPGFRPSKRFDCVVAKRTFNIPDDTSKNGFGTAPENIKQQYQINRCFIKPEYPVEKGKVWAITDIVCCDSAWRDQYIKSGYVVCTQNQSSTPSQSIGSPCDLNMNIGGSNNFIVLKYEIVDILSNVNILSDIITSNTNRDYLETRPGMSGILTVGIPQHGNKSVIAQNKGTSDDCSHYQGCWIRMEPINNAIKYINSIGITVMGSNSDAKIKLSSHITENQIELTERSEEELHSSCGRGKSTLYLNAAYAKISRITMRFMKKENILEYYGSNIALGVPRFNCELLENNTFDITKIISGFIKYFNLETPLISNVYLYVPIDNLPNDPGKINNTTPPPINLNCEISGYPINVVNSNITLQGFLNVSIMANI